MKKSSPFLAYLILSVIMISIVNIAISEINAKECTQVGVNDAIVERTLSSKLVLQVDDEVDEAEGMRRSLQTTAMLLIPALILLIGSLLWSYSLKAQVDKKTAELKQEIIKREEMQEQMVRQEKLVVLGQLAGGVGHELRNPLGAIKNAVYFLNMVLEKPEPEVKESLEILDKEVVRSEIIISSLLDFARTKPPKKRKININERIRESLSHIAVPDNVKVNDQLNDTLPTVLVDPDQLDRVFENITLNAVQAMPDGGELTLKSELASAEWVTVSITDTGVGISEDKMKKLFEPLFTTKAKGIGLGLAVSRTLTEANGGEITAHSEVGKGSTFTVKLPTT
ncbi:sensor histidine kinase [[Eubacterium] cellulosolvens]